MRNIDQIRKQLEKRLHELNERAEDIDEDLSAPADDDWQEAAVEAAGDEVLEELGEVTLEEVTQIKQALARIDSGKYGICVSCGEDIAEARLQAIPYATKCVACAL